MLEPRYTVVVGDTVACDCPDAQKGNVCKHRVFVLVRVLQAGQSSPLVYQNALLPSERARLLGSAPASAAVAPEAVRAAYSSATGKAPPPASAAAAGRGGRELEPAHRGEASDDCPICFEALGAAGLEVCTACKNGVHADCMRKWAAARRGAGQQANCPHCRATWAGASAGTQNSAGHAAAAAGAEGFLNLAAAAGDRSAEREEYGGRWRW